MHLYLCMNEDVSSSLQTLNFLKYFWFGSGSGNSTVARCWSYGLSCDKGKDYFDLRACLQYADFCSIRFRHCLLQAIPNLEAC